MTTELMVVILILYGMLVLAQGLTIMLLKRENKNLKDALGKVIEKKLKKK